jgi:hypothetical protein
MRSMNDCFSTTVSEPAPTRVSIRRALLDAVEQGLLAPGKIVRAAIYERIEEKYQLKREEIPDELDTFHKALQDLLGKGAHVVRRLIVKDLYSRLDMRFIEHDTWTLADYVHQAKKTRQR